MHKQASINNVRHPTVLKNTLRRRGMIIGAQNATIDPLDQYKPSVAAMVSNNNSTA
jgi:hypothetical protein